MSYLDYFTGMYITLKKTIMHKDFKINAMQINIKLKIRINPKIMSLLVITRSAFTVWNFLEECFELDKIEIHITECISRNRVGFFFRKKQQEDFFQLQLKRKGKICLSQLRDNYQFKHIKDSIVTFYNIKSWRKYCINFFIIPIHCLFQLCLILMIPSHCKK